MEAETDADLILASMERPSVFGEIFRRYYPQVLRYASRRAGPDLREEIAAQTFFIAFDRRGTFDPSYVSALPWLLGIETNVVRQHFRTKATHDAALGRMPAISERQEDPSTETIEALALREQLFTALEHVAPHEKEMVFLLALADLSYAQIAQAMGVPIGTVRSTLHRVRSVLRERLGDLMQIPGQDDDG